MSNDIQNGILDVIKVTIQESIVEKVSNSGVWAIIADDTTDISNREQMAVIVRYINMEKDEFVIREDPIALLDVFETLRQIESKPKLKMSGSNLVEVLLGKVHKLNSDLTKLVAQCYDGALSMASLKVPLCRLFPLRRTRFESCHFDDV